MRKTDYLEKFLDIGKNVTDAASGMVKVKLYAIGGFVAGLVVAMILSWFFGLFATDWERRYEKSSGELEQCQFYLRMKDDMANPTNGVHWNPSTQNGILGHSRI